MFDTGTQRAEALGNTKYVAITPVSECARYRHLEERVGQAAGQAENTTIARPSLTKRGSLSLVEDEVIENSTGVGPVP